jgi:hypothetical protein
VSVYISVRKENKSYLDFCSKVKLRVSNIFLITFLSTRHRFKIPTKEYFTCILNVCMQIIIIIIIDNICDTNNM